MVCKAHIEIFRVPSSIWITCLFKKWERRNAAFNIKLIISFRSDKNPSTYSLNKRFKTLIRDIKRNKKRGENQSKGDCLLVFGGRPETGYRKSLNLNPFAIGPERNTPFPHLGRTMSTAWDRINTTYCSNDSNFLKDLTAPNSNSQHWTLVLTFKIPFEACKKERFSFYFSSEGRYEERKKKWKKLNLLKNQLKWVLRNLDGPCWDDYNLLSSLRRHSNTPTRV